MLAVPASPAPVLRRARLCWRLALLSASRALTEHARAQAPDRTVAQITQLAERFWFLLFAGINLVLLVFLNSLERHFRPATRRILEKAKEEEDKVRNACTHAQPDGVQLLTRCVRAGA